VIKIEDLAEKAEVIAVVAANLKVEAEVKREAKETQETKTRKETRNILAAKVKARAAAHNLNLVLLLVHLDQVLQHHRKRAALHKRMVKKIR